jgi:ATP-dependent Zn protease
VMTYQRMQQERTARLHRGVRSLLDDGTDEHTAIHEAAHVLCAAMVGFRPTFATINPGPGSAGRTDFGKGAISAKMDRAKAFNHCLVRLAGPEGERLVGRDDPDDSAKNDLSEARRAAGLVCSSEAEVSVLVDRARRQARRMLKANFGSLLAVTARLLEKREIGEDEIAELLASSIPDDADDDDEDDDGSLMLPAILAAITGRVLFGAPEPIQTRQRRDLVFYGGEP